MPKMPLLRGIPLLSRRDGRTFQTFEEFINEVPTLLEIVPSLIFAATIIDLVLLR
jgi:hypothetical protein